MVLSSVAATVTLGPLIAMAVPVLLMAASTSVDTILEDTTMPTDIPLALINADAADVASLLSVEVMPAVDVAVTSRSPAAVIGEFRINALVLAGV